MAGEFNGKILIKRSTTNSNPVNGANVLFPGELAYSYVAGTDTLFIGNTATDGRGEPIAIGGKNFTDRAKRITIDTANNTVTLAGESGEDLVIKDPKVKIGTNEAVTLTDFVNDLAETAASGAAGDVALNIGDVALNLADGKITLGTNLAATKSGDNVEIALGSDVATLSGAQTVSGVKTFSAQPVIHLADSEASNVATEAYVDNAINGFSQTIQVGSVTVDMSEGGITVGDDLSVAADGNNAKISLDTTLDQTYTFTAQPTIHLSGSEASNIATEAYADAAAASAFEDGITGITGAVTFAKNGDNVVGTLAKNFLEVDSASEASVSTAVKFTTTPTIKLGDAAAANVATVTDVANAVDAVTLTGETKNGLTVSVADKKISAKIDNAITAGSVGPISYNGNGLITAVAADKDAVEDWGITGGTFADTVTLKATAQYDSTYNLTSIGDNSRVLVPATWVVDKVNEIIEDSGSKLFRWKGSVATVNDLPTSNNVVGDVYNVVADGANYVWVPGDSTLAAPNDVDHWDKLSADGHLLEADFNALITNSHTIKKTSGGSAALEIKSETSTGTQVASDYVLLSDGSGGVKWSSLATEVGTISGNVIHYTTEDSVNKFGDATYQYNGTLGAGVEVPAAQITAGALASGVTVAATQVTAGALASDVTIAGSSVTGNIAASQVNGALTNATIATSALTGDIDCGTF